MKKLITLLGTFFVFIQSFAQMGKVPSQALLHGSMSGIKGELAIFWTSHTMPNENLQKLDPQKTKQDSTKITNAFLVAVIDSVLIEGIMMYRPLTIVAWWIPLKSAKNIDLPQHVADLPNNVHWVAVKTWYSDKEICNLYKSRGLNVGHLEVSTNFSAETKTADLTLDGDRIRISITKSGAVQKNINVLPKYTIIWHAGSDLQDYTVFSHGKIHIITTYEAAKLEFVTKPKTQLGKMLEELMQTGNFSQNFQTGWNNKFGEYKK